MANSILTIDVIAKEALMVLENELVAAKRVHRGLESEFGNGRNGYQTGATVTIKRPTDFTVRSGSNASVQDVVEGSTTITVDQQKGVDFAFTSQELTLNIKDLSERVIKPAMVQLANRIDSDVLALATKVPNWVGTPGQLINSFQDFAPAPQRLDEQAVMSDGRTAILSPADHWGMLGTQTNLYIQGAANDAYRKGDLGRIGGVDTFMSQNVQTLTTGSRAGSILIDLSITAATIEYTAVKDTMVQTIHMDGFATATDTVKAGEVFTIAGVYAVNPVTKTRLPWLKQFTVMADAVCAGSETDVQIYPAMIWSGAFKNVDVVGTADLNNQAVSFLGSAGTTYAQNLAFHKNAFALAIVPMVSPPGAVDVARESYKGVSVRMIPFYNGSSDVSTLRLDVLYGLKAIDPRLATRISGMA
ncbi:P22 phage major capsid protein family protein [Rhizorhabdus phycosphaerae]|uniref:P22 phage major capsid protein family protein n=1 Tax=Rhizorhabdus phycosphaerae TaxID=2711156 RepID=UPI0013E9A063|nr:P22 phage major capsid protein family protein [Rhizorhabdus phycosphaerae]